MTPLASGAWSSVVADGLILLMSGTKPSFSKIETGSLLSGGFEIVGEAPMPCPAALVEPPLVPPGAALPVPKSGNGPVSGKPSGAATVSPEPAGLGGSPTIGSGIFKVPGAGMPRSEGCPGEAD